MGVAQPSWALGPDALIMAARPGLKWYAAPVSRLAGGAVLAEATLAGAAVVEWGHLVAVADAAGPAGDPIARERLSSVVRAVADGGPQRPGALVGRLGDWAERALVHAVVSAGRGAAAQRQGLFGTRRGVEVTPAAAAEVRGRLEAAMTPGNRPDPGAATLLALASAAGLLRHVLPSAFSREQRGQLQDVVSTIDPSTRAVVAAVRAAYAAGVGGAFFVDGIHGSDSGDGGSHGGSDGGFDGGADGGAYGGGDGGAGGSGGDGGGSGSGGSGGSG